jgi:adenylyltransferase/sulfurtransferase
MNPAEEPLEINVQDVRKLRDAGEDFLLLDCRESDEHAIAAIDGAWLMPMGEIADRVGELAGYEGRRIVVHCHVGGRSLRVAAWLRQQGFPRAQSMAGGIDQWAAEIEPGVPRY